MNDYFGWKGQQSTNYGVHMLTPPSIITPKERVESIEVPGRSGTLTMTQGEDVYDALSLSITCIIHELYNEAGEYLPPKIAGWLKGSGAFTIPQRSDGFYKGRIVNQLSFERILRNHPHRLFSVELQCEPYFYYTSGHIWQDVGEDTKFTNPGNVASKPTFRVKGTSGYIVTPYNYMIINDISDLDYLTIDCEAKVAYKGEVGSTTNPMTLANDRIGGDWIEFPTGEHYITKQGDLSEVIMLPRWRCV